MRNLTLFLLLLLCTLGLSAQQDSLLTSVIWAETTKGEREGYSLRLNEFGPFEEDAGEDFNRSSRYLLGRWELDSTGNQLTLAVDYFMGQKIVHSRYRRGQDFYLEYLILSRSAEELILKDLLTGKLRTFTATPIADAPDVGERRAQKIELGRKKGGLKLPKGW